MGEILENGFYRPFPMSFVMTITYVVCILMVIVCVLSALSPLLIMAKPDNKNEKEIEIAGNNNQGLSRAVLDEGKLLLQRANGVSQMAIDVIAFMGKKKKKISYNISFNGEYASLDLPQGVTDVKLVVLNADGRIVNKKKIGYPNTILLIVSSVLIAVGLGVLVMLHALYHNQEMDEFNIGYGIIFYALPFVIGAILGAANFFVSKIITKSFNKGGK